MPTKALRSLLSCFGLCVAFTVTPARADPCRSPSLSPCFDANALWPAPGSARFVSMPDTGVTPNAVSLGLTQEYLHAPVVAAVASPDPAGRQIKLVNHVLDTSLHARAAVVDGLTGSLVLPVRTYQSGAGIAALTTQSAPAITASALRDPRLGLAYSFDRLLRAPGLGVATFLELSLPLGDQAAFAGERSLVVMPRVLLSGHYDRFYAELALGARLRQASTFGDIHIGDQGFSALGLGLDVLQRGLLFVGAEAWLMPSLDRSRATAKDTTWVPAEWLLSAQSRFQAESHWSLQLAGGGGIPLSSAAGEHFAGVTTPELRLLASGRYDFSLPGQ